MNQQMNSVGRNIARLRLARGMTQERLAQRMGVTPQAVSKWENDINYPDVATLPRLAALLGTSVDALLTAPDDAGPQGPAPSSGADGTATDAEPALTGPAARYGKTAAQVVLRWHLQEGNVTFPKTLNPQHMADNLDIFDFTLTEEEMAAVNALPQRPYYQVPDEPPAFVTTVMDYSRQA